MVTALVSGIRRLAELGLSVEIIANALRRADRQASICTFLDPPILEGLLRWGRTTRFLREELIPLGWSYDNPRNLARTIHPSAEFAIVVATGDEWTGLPGHGAGPRHLKGYAMEQAIHANGQLAFDFGSLVHVNSVGQAAGLDALCTWLLLLHSEPHHFQAELSLPDEFENGRITGWTERILLPSIPREAATAQSGPILRHTADRGQLGVRLDRGS